jgi:DNA-binding transcriptional ArsR family regulator
VSPSLESISDPLAELIAHRLRILAQPLRIQLIDKLRHGAAPVHELTDAVGGVQQNVSRHLALLHQAGILTRRKEGTQVHYELVDPHVLPLLSRAQASLTDHLGELSRLIGPGRQQPPPPHRR